MRSQTASDDAVTVAAFRVLAAARADTYGLLRNLYAQKPASEWVKGLLTGEVVRSLSRAGHGEFRSAEIVEGLDKLRRCVEGLRRMSAKAALMRLAVDRTRLLGGVAPGYGPPFPSESVYREGRLMGDTTRAVAQSYHKLAVYVPQDSYDPPDYVAFELDFMRVLCAKEAEAWGSGEVNDALQLLRREESFLEDHILQWVPRFCEEVLRETRITDFYRGVAQLTKGFLLQEEGDLKLYLAAARELVDSKLQEAASPGS